jgi:hypothetical protein
MISCSHWGMFQPYPFHTVQFINGIGLLSWIEHP